MVSQPDSSPIAWRNRIVDHGEEQPSALLENPRNWRAHPKAQQDALAAVLDSVGWVQRVIVNRRTGHLVDGHLRTALAVSRGEATIPVEYVDLSPEEETLVLATLDPIAAMASADKVQLEALLRDLDGGQDAEIEMLLRTISADQGITPPEFQPVDISEQGRLDEKSKTRCPECGHEFAP